MSFHPYRRKLENGILIASTESCHAEQLELLQVTVFPTLSVEERFRRAHYLKHIEIFPEGQFVALDGERVVGMTSTVRLHFDFEHNDHTFSDIIQEGWLTSHEPEGQWLYGADIGTDPQYRRMGIAKALYRARQDCVSALGLSGQVTVGMLSGFEARAGSMDVDKYYAAVSAGDLYDPTVSTQMRVGFELRGLLKDYVKDPVCGNAGALLVMGVGSEI